MSEVRLQVVLARAGVAARRKAEEYVKEGRVSVNGQVVTELGTKIDPAVDKVAVDGVPLDEAQPRATLVLYKPDRVVTTVSDPEGRATVLTLLADEPFRFVPVGRLDFHTEGVLLLSTDGELVNRLLHPRYHVPKVYRVKVAGHPSEADLNVLRSGVPLEDGPTRPAVVEVLESDDKSTWLEMVVTEGRNRLVRRMCDAIHHTAFRVVRTEFATIGVGQLRPGQYRYLSGAELGGLYKTAGLPAPGLSERAAEVEGLILGEGARSRGSVPGDQRRSRGPKSERRPAGGARAERGRGAGGSSFGPRPSERRQGGLDDDREGADEAPQAQAPRRGLRPFDRGRFEEEREGEGELSAEGADLNSDDDRVLDLDALEAEGEGPGAVDEDDDGVVARPKSRGPGAKAGAPGGGARKFGGNAGGERRAPGGRGFGGERRGAGRDRSFAPRSGPGRGRGEGGGFGRGEGRFERGGGGQGEGRDAGGEGRGRYGDRADRGRSGGAGRSFSGRGRSEGSFGAGRGGGAGRGRTSFERDDRPRREDRPRTGAGRGRSFGEAGDRRPSDRDRSSPERKGRSFGRSAEGGERRFTRDAEGGERRRFDREDRPAPRRRFEGEERPSRGRREGAKEGDPRTRSRFTRSAEGEGGRAGRFSRARTEDRGERRSAEGQGEVRPRGRSAGPRGRGGPGRGGVGPRERGGPRGGGRPGPRRGPGR